MSISLFANDKEYLEEIEELIELDRASVNNLQIQHSALVYLKGLQEFSNLVSIDLTANSISTISIYTKGLVKVRHLNLSCNLLTSLNGIENLISLEYADFSSNKIRNLQALSELSNFSNRNLKMLQLQDNRIATIDQLYCLVK